MSITHLHGDCRELLCTLPDASVQCIVTSPPYWRMRRYTDDPREIGQELTPAAYVEALRAVFAECRRVLRPDGTLWINIGDAYANDGKWGGATSDKHAGGVHGCDGPGRKKVQTGLPPKSLIGLPWRVAFALQDDGWILRNDNIWHKPSSMPESVNDRCARNHEYVFMFSASSHYCFEWEAIAPASVKVDRPQYRRAIELAQAAGLTDAHFSAIRSAGITDSGKGQAQMGAGRNIEDVQRLAAEAKAALGGYYREFLTADIRRPATVWSINPQPLADEHYAPMPQALAERCIRAGSKPGNVVLDPFGGSGTTARAAVALGRSAILMELGEQYIPMQERRTDGVQLSLEAV